MTEIWFVRHAEPLLKGAPDAERGLTPRGKEDCRLVTAFFRARGVDAILSSPYRRALETVRPLAEELRLPIEHVQDFRERRIDSTWVEDFSGFCRQQWTDFDFHLPDGESLRQVQTRCIAALEIVLRQYEGQRVVIGCHGTAISTVLNHYEPSFHHAQFEAIRRLMPWAVRLDFEGLDFLRWEGFPLK